MPGSIEVYSIKDFGAIEFGEHIFKNNQESADTPSQIGKFVTFWKKQDSKWKITKAVSLHKGEKLLGRYIYSFFS